MRSRRRRHRRHHRPQQPLVTRASVHSIVSRLHEQEIPKERRLDLANPQQTYILQYKVVFFRFETLDESFLVVVVVVDDIVVVVAVAAVLEVSKGFDTWSDTSNTGRHLDRARASRAKKNELKVVTVDLQVADPEVQYSSPFAQSPSQ